MACEKYVLLLRKTESGIGAVLFYDLPGKSIKDYAYTAMYAQNLCGY